MALIPDRYKGFQIVVSSTDQQTWQGSVPDLRILTGFYSTAAAALQECRTIVDAHLRQR